ncbi:MAG TPA: hypothetical protein VFL63_07915, partial [Rhodanobacteraceae bacterium]|nr:hypothetical protein [Rhodanobacteraceae bacterium]
MHLPRQADNEADGKGEDQCETQRCGEACECQFDLDLSAIHGTDEQREQSSEDDRSTEEKSPHDVKPDSQWQSTGDAQRLADCISAPCQTTDARVRWSGLVANCVISAVIDPLTQILAG